jgi:ABC-2 type transport system permease protein
MWGSVFLETLHRARQDVLYSAVLAATLALLVILMVPLMDAMKLVDLLKTLPPMLLRAAGMGNDLTLLARPEGFIAVGVFGKFLLLFCVYPVAMGLRVTSSEENDGTLDILLSLPVRRHQVILEKFAAYSLTICVLLVVMSVALVLGTQLITIPLDLGRLMLLVVNLLPMLVFILAFTIFLGGLIGRRGVVMGLVTAFIMGSYVLQTVTDIADTSITSLPRYLSFFTYYDAAGVVTNGLNGLHIAGLLVTAIVLVLLGIAAFERRDVGV